MNETLRSLGEVIYTQDSAYARIAKLEKALYNCGFAAHNGGTLMDSKRRGGREKLAYIERIATEGLQR